MTKKEIKAKRARAVRRAARVRAVIRGTAECPRLSVFRSQKHISAQVIDDVAGRTLASAQDAKLAKLSPLERAQEVGKIIADSAKKAGVSKVVFDRGAYLFHGRVKALAEAAREAGLQF